MTTSPKNRIRSLLPVALVLGFLCGARIARADADAAKVRDQRQKEIAAKSEAERARLQRSFKAFRDLPPTEQDRLRQLDRELKDDARAGGGLRGVMDDYYNWLATLTPGQQQDLREIADPTRREMRVRELMKEQQEQAEAGGPGRGGRSPNRLSPKDLSAVLDVIEQALRDNHLLTQADVQRLESRKDLARRVEEIGRAHV